MNVRVKNVITSGSWLMLVCLFFSMECLSQQKQLDLYQNKCVIDTVIKYGPYISPTYQQAVCIELVIKVIEKFYALNRTDRSKIRIITNEDVHDMLARNSPVPKGVYYALTMKGIGEPIDDIRLVQAGDFVQFWTDWWGHCGIVKSINRKTNKMELYSSFPTTDGYGVQEFDIPRYCYFVRLKRRT